jgi:peptidoglycan/xylan/chitin deacetylase (PgdA/CDA1 family)
MTLLKLLSLWALTISGGNTFARFVRRRIFKKHYIGILAYHHLAQGPLGPIAPVGLSPKIFSRQVKILTKMFKVFLMKDFAVFIKNNTIPEDGLVFTFDDGYRDAFDVAAPILEAAGARGVFYVTGVSFTKQPYLWNDLVGEVFDSLTPLNFNVLDEAPLKLRDLLKKIAVSKGKKRERFTGLAFQSILDENQASRENICQSLYRILGSNAPRFHPSRTLMTPEQIVDLSRRGHEIGAHTLTHTRLSKSRKFARDEVIESAERLRINEIPVSSFAYPFGGEADIGASWVEMLKEAGISNAVTMEKNAATPTCDPYLLPRIPVSPYHGASFLIALFEMLAWRRLIASWIILWKQTRIMKRAFPVPYDI